MNKIIDNVVRYLVRHYPESSELNKTKLTKLVYLIDWKYAQKYRDQVTNIKWKFDHYGPYVSDVIEAVIADKDLSINETYSVFGTAKYIINSNIDKDLLDYGSLTSQQISIIDEVILETKSLYWNDFIDHVYSTYPIVHSERYSDLNLVSLAEEESR